MKQSIKNEIIELKILGGMDLNPTLIDFVLSHRKGIVDRWLEEVENNTEIDQIVSISRKVIQDTNKDFVDILINNIQKDSQDLSTQLKEFTEDLIRKGWPLSYITEGLQAFRRVLLEYFFEESGDKSVRFLEALQAIDDWVNPVVNQIVVYYTTTWENKVSLQKMALEELSSPIIPLLEKITVMPLIGTIDTDRAKKIMENLLEGVVKHRSEVVLIDITGVPVVDTMVAHHIIQAVEAVRLIGAKAILVGIRPEIAQTIVNLGIDLSQLPTKSTMKKGIEAALEYTNRQIVAAQ